MEKKVININKEDVIACGTDEKVKIWSLNGEEEPIITLDLHVDLVSCLASIKLKKEFYLVSSSLDSTTKLI